MLRQETFKKIYQKSGGSGRKERWITMGEQFWWFYDVIAAAAVAVCAFLAGRKGPVKSMVTFVGCIIALFVGISAGSGISKPLYSNIMRDSNVTKLTKTIESEKLPEKVAEKINSMGYLVTVDQKKLQSIYETDLSKKRGSTYDSLIYSYMNSINSKKVDDEDAFIGKLHEAYAEIIKDFVSEELSPYAAEIAYREILRGFEKDDGKFNELIPLLMDIETKKPAAEYIVDEYTESAYVEVIRLITMVGLMAVIIVVSLLLSKTLSSGQDEYVSPGAHMIGGIIGLLTGAVIVVLIAAIVRLYAVMGNNEMMFFNNKAIDRTYVFKYVYDFITNKIN